MPYIYWKRVHGTENANRFAEKLESMGVPILARSVVPYKLHDGSWRTYHFFRLSSAHEVDADYAHFCLFHIF